MQDIAIVGVGGTSRDILEAVELQCDSNQRWNIIGFFDDDPRLVGQSVIGYPVLGPLSFLKRHEFDKISVVIGVANDRQLLIRRDIAERLDLPPERYPVIIHPSATVSKRARVGVGTVILSGAFCSNEVVLGKHVIILQNSVIGHDSHVGDFVSVAANVGVAGAVQVDEGAYLGMGCSVLPHRIIGRSAVIGSGGVVMRDIPAEAVVFGNPARIIGGSFN